LARPTVFLAGRYSLFENEAADPKANVQAWKATFGNSPSFEEPSDCVAGLHFPLDDDERGMVIAHSAGSDAVRDALRLIKLKYDLETVRLLRRPPVGTGYSSDDLDSMGETDVSVWPSEPAHDVRDSVVAYCATANGYLHRVRLDPECLWAALSPRVEEAAQFKSAHEATEWLAENIEGDDQYRLIWRSVALAEQDREEESYNQAMQG
jgi:hypothetical protein